MKSFFKKAFPIPGVLLEPHVSVDISDSSLRFFEFSYKNGRLEPNKFGLINFPKIQGDKTTDKAKSEAVNSLMEFKKKYGYSQVRLVLNEADVYVFKTSVPTVDLMQISQIIDSTLEENVPIPLIDAVFEYEIIETDRVREETRVAVSVASEKNLSFLIDIFSTAGIEIVSFDTEARCIARCIYDKKENPVNISLHINNKHSAVSIIENGATVFSSSIESGYIDALDLLSKSSEGLSIKERFEIMEPALLPIKNELIRVIDYWKSQESVSSSFKGVSSIILSGGLITVPGFYEYISDISKYPVFSANVWKKILSLEDRIPEISKKESLEYAHLIGSFL